MWRGFTAFHAPFPLQATRLDRTTALRPTSVYNFFICVWDVGQQLVCLLALFAWQGGIQQRRGQLIPGVISIATMRECLREVDTIPADIDPAFSPTATRCCSASTSASKARASCASFA